MSDQHDDRSVVESQIAYHPLCKVCSSANRHAIEVQLLLGESGPRIAKRFPADNLNRQNLHTHRHRHMEALDSAVAEAVRAHTLEARRDAAHAVSAVTARLGQVESLLAADRTRPAAPRISPTLKGEERSRTERMTRTMITLSHWPIERPVACLRAASCGSGRRTNSVEIRRRP